MRKLTLIILILVTLILSSCGETESEVYEMELLDGQDTVEINTTWVDAGSRLVILDGYKYNYVTGTGIVDTTTLGLYEITYATTYLELEYEITRYVIVVDQIAPELTLVIGVDTILLNEEWIDPGVDSSDNSNGTIITSVTGTVDNTTLGTYLIVYTATDESGNESSITRVVTVLE